MEVEWRERWKSNGDRDGSRMEREMERCSPEEAKWKIEEEQRKTAAFIAEFGKK